MKTLQPQSDTAHKEGLYVEVFPQGADRCIILVNGRLDFDSNEELDRALHDALDEGWREIQVDLSGVTYLSSLGVTIFIEAMATVEQRGGHISFVNINPRIEPVLQLIGILEQS